MKILIVEDETELLESIIEYLSNQGYTCETAPDFKIAHEKLAIYNYDCLVVDINLPYGSGLDLIQFLKKSKKTTGIIIISARDQLDDRLRGLELGADDYLTKPFNLAELNARIKSLYRRIHFDGNNSITVGKLTINPDEFKVFVATDEINLTKTEYDMLMFFISNKDRVLTKETIAEHLWGDYIDASDSLDFVYTHIKNLRKKLNKFQLNHYIQNIYGVGYKFTLS